VAAELHQKSTGACRDPIVSDTHAPVICFAAIFERFDIFVELQIALKAVLGFAARAD
jgi:hypothetical protein